MTDRQILDRIETRVSAQRTADAHFTFVDAQGKPLPGVRAQIKLARHEFKLGANAFNLGRITDPSLHRQYNDRFVALLNYATLPFYWGTYEPEAGRTGEERLGQMAGWCAHYNVTAKGHPLVWHEVFPKWAETLPDEEVRRRLKRRIARIIGRFKTRIQIWDVVNEATVSENFGNAVGRWVKASGAAAVVAECLGWAHEADSGACLLYNDFNVSDAFKKLAGDLRRTKAPFHALGIQSHMHKGTWPVKKIWTVCETYARFGVPLHFTEMTALSGALKAADDNDWHKVRTDWPSTRDGEAAQADYGEMFYKILFSHPAVEAVTWWDFSDQGSWQGAPAGLLRQDMSPKPLYERLVTLFQKHWATNATVSADARGAANARCFFGTHQVSARTDSGLELSGSFELARRGKREFKIILK